MVGIDKIASADDVRSRPHHELILVDIANAAAMGAVFAAHRADAVTRLATESYFDRHRCAKRPDRRAGKTELGRRLHELAEGATARRPNASPLPTSSCRRRLAVPIRAFFSKAWKERCFTEADIPGPLVQNNHSFSRPRAARCVGGTRRSRQMCRTNRA